MALGRIIMHRCLVWSLLDVFVVLVIDI